MKVRCNKSKECNHYGCGHFHAHDYDSDFGCDVDSCSYFNTVKCIPINKKWSHEETQYLVRLYQSNLYLTMKEVCYILNNRFQNNRTEEACKSKYYKYGM